MEASGNGLELGGLRSVDAWEQAPAAGVVKPLKMGHREDLVGSCWVIFILNRFRTIFSPRDPRKCLVVDVGNRCTLV